MMSLKELNDRWERDFLGYTFSKRLEQRLLAEQMKRLAVGHRIFESVVVAVLDKRKCIKDIGVNIPSDLILDNFGTWLASLIRTPVQADSTVVLTDVTPASRTFAIFRASSTGNFMASAQVLGTNVQVGSSTVAAARGDTAIGTPFGTAPESGRFGSGSGSYSTGAISFSGAITAGGSGTVRETGFFGRWIDTSPALRDVMLFHDILATGVGFSAGQIITVSYSISI